MMTRETRRGPIARPESTRRRRSTFSSGARARASLSIMRLPPHESALSTGIWPAVFAFIMSAAACESSVPPAAVVSDSAGIRVVTNQAPVWDEDQAWEVDPEPLLTVGSVEGDPELAFDRVSGVYLLPTVGLVVLDEGAGSIRFFDESGMPNSTFGRSGEGPGEFQNLSFLGLRTDSLWVFDARQRRTTVIHPESAGFRVTSADVRDASHGPVGLLADGSLIVAADIAFSTAIEEQSTEGLQRFDAAYVLVNASGIARDTVLVTRGSERILMLGPEFVQLLRPLLARSVSHAVRGDDLVHGVQEHYEIGVYSTDGGVHTLIRRSDVDVRIDEPAYEAAVEERVLRAPEPARPGLRALYDEQPRPDGRPAYARFLIDSDGFLWVQEFAYIGASSSWAIFDLDGLWLGMVEFPDRFRPTQILRDRVVGVWRDELDVEYARVYGLARR